MERLPLVFPSFAQAYPDCRRFVHALPICSTVPPSRCRRFPPAPDSPPIATWVDFALQPEHSLWILRFSGRFLFARNLNRRNSSVLLEVSLRKMPDFPAKMHERRPCILSDSAEFHLVTNCAIHFNLLFKRRQNNAFCFPYFAVFAMLQFTCIK